MRRSCAFPGELQHRLSQAHSLVAVLIVHLRSHTALEQGSIKTDVKRNTSPEQSFEHCSASSPGGFHSLVHPRGNGASLRHLLGLSRCCLAF